MAFFESILVYGFIIFKLRSHNIYFSEIALQLPILIASGIALSEPTGSSALVDAARWINDVLLGTVATTVAVIAIALVGFAMLGGRIKWRRGAMVIFGCFLLFGARGIVEGFLPQGETFTSAAAAPPAPPPGSPPNDQNVYDPYAGAAPKRN